MKVILVDDESMAIDIFLHETRNLSYIEVVSCFDNGIDALAYTKKHNYDVAILDIQMDEMNGLELAKAIREYNSTIKIVFITGSDSYVADAVHLNVDGYITKPYSSGEIAFTLEKIKQDVMAVKKRIYAKTFGHFDLYVDGKPIMFRSAKAKELLAYLVDRQGGTVTTDQIIGTLWEDRPNDEATQNLCSKVVRALKNELKEYHAEDILVLRRGIRRVDINTFDCDLYDLLNGDDNAKKMYLGEYMMQYSWAESRMASLDNLSFY